ncbi:hypothetical protein C8J31_11363 [Rhizobium sp. PP-CC-2G-626]|nr:hypothetical protein C8J31_11363 [Rhizobium sp. PP-CC-2G-626]
MKMLMKMPFGLKMPGFAGSVPKPEKAPGPGRENKAAGFVAIAQEGRAHWTGRSYRRWRGRAFCAIRSPIARCG